MAYDVDASTIRGLALSVQADGKTIGLTVGHAYLPNQGRAVVENPMTLLLTGLTSTWRHFYLANDLGVVKFEADAVAPDNPYQGTARTKLGDTTRRYLGSLYFNSAGIVIPFIHSQPGDRANRIDFNPPGGAAITQTRLINVATNQTPTMVDASAVVPVTCRLLYALIDNTSTSDAYIGTPDDGTLSTTNFKLFVKANQAGQFDVVVNGNQQLNFFMNGLITLGGLTIRVRGYVFDR